jgi:hypothetical protein
MRLAKFFPKYAEDNLCDAEGVALWCKEEASELARRFDQRNETDHFNETLAETLELKKLCAPFPLNH